MSIKKVQYIVCPLCGLNRIRKKIGSVALLKYRAAMNAIDGRYGDEAQKKATQYLAKLSKPYFGGQKGEISFGVVDVNTGVFIDNRIATGGSSGFVRDETFSFSEAINLPENKAFQTQIKNQCLKILSIIEGKGIEPIVKPKPEIIPLPSILEVKDKPVVIKPTKEKAPSNEALQEEAQEIIDKILSSKSINITTIKKAVNKLEIMGIDIDEVINALEEYQNIDKSDYDDKDDYKAEKEEAWDNFIFALEDISLEGIILTPSVSTTTTIASIAPIPAPIRVIPPEHKKLIDYFLPKIRKTAESAGWSKERFEGMKGLSIQQEGIEVLKAADTQDIDMNRLYDDIVSLLPDNEKPSTKGSWR